MKRFWIFGLCLALLAAVLAPKAVLADEEEVNEAMGLLSGRMTNVESALKLKFSGDVRVRGEYFYQDWDPVYNTSNRILDRYRTRLRVRFGATKKIADDINTYVGFATGQVFFQPSVTAGVTFTEPTSTNQTLTGDGSLKNFSLDKAAIEFSPSWADGKLTLIGGKMVNPMRFTAITWDGDLNPEGVALKFNPVANTDFSFMYFVLQENSGGPEAYLVQAQLNQNFMVGDADCSFLVGGEVVPQISNAFYPHTLYKGLTSLGMVTDSTPGNLAIPDIVMGEAMFSLKTKVGEEKIALGFTAHAAYNFESFDINGTTVPAVLASPTYSGGTISNALALLAKVDLGKADPGAFSTFLEFGMIDPNAVYALFSDSDSGPGGNNNTWIKGNITLGVTKDMTFGITQYADWHTTYDVFGSTYNASLGGTGRTPLFRTQIDAVVKL